VGKQVIDERIERDGEGALDVDESVDAGDAVGLVNEDLVLGEKFCVRPAQRDGRGEQKDAEGDESCTIAG
jgi:hypothetical protein